MKTPKTYTFVGLVLVLIAFVASAEAAPRTAGVFTDHMVLQRDIPVAVWGWADPGEAITVSLAGHSCKTTADSDGKWSCKLPKMDAGGPFELRVEGKDASITKEDVFVGEVWLCSGQSNMVWPVSRSNNFEKEKAAADLPKIRMFTVQRRPSDKPEDDCQGEWVVCSPETVGSFSAAGFFFGRELFEALDVPIGLINSSWGGTPVQAWTSMNSQKSVSEIEPVLQQWKEQVEKWPQTKQSHDKRMAAWKAAVAKAKEAGEKAPNKPRPPQNPLTNPRRPACLFNGMIAPLVPYTIRGAIWYQGEANSRGPSDLYGLQLQTMIDNWRALWKQGDFAFIYVQLANFRTPQTKPVEENGWVIVQEEQFKTLKHPNTGMAVIIDIGEANNIHPTNKQDVGKRLALWALGTTYGQDLTYSGPLYKSMEKKEGKIVLRFDHVDGGLVAKGGELQGFTVAGADKEFVWAKAIIEGDTVVVSADEVKDPVAVRYGWSANPKCNLYNKAGLPASPFRTDSK